MTYFCNYLEEVAYICNYCLIISNLTNFFLLNALLKKCDWTIFNYNYTI